MEFILSWQGLALLVPISVTLALYLLQSTKTNLNEQLMDPQDRADIRAALQRNEPLTYYLSALDTLFLKPSQRFFGPPLSWNAFQQCLNIAFLYPMVVLTISWAAGAECSFGKSSCPIPTYLPIGPERWWRASLLLTTFAVSLGVGFVVARQKRVIVKFVIDLLPVPQQTAENEDSLVRLGIDIGCTVLLWYLLQTLLFQVFVQPTFPVPGGGTIAAGVIGITLFAAVGYANGRREFWFLPIVLILVFLVVQIMDGRYGPAIVGFIMGLALPVLNGLTDWLSLYITRSLVGSMRNSRSGFIAVTAISIRILSDFVIALAVLALLVAMTSVTIVALNQWVVVGIIGREPIDLWRLVELARASPFSEGFFVTFTLATTFFPTLAHLIAGITGVAFTLSPRNSRAARLIPTDTMAHFSASKRQAVIRTLMWRSIWIMPAAVISIGLLAGFFLVVSYLTTPVGQLLSDIAYCSTAWSHGICPSQPPSFANK